MTEAILVALITGGLSLLGVILTSGATARRVDFALEKAQAITETKLEALTREVREHNGFARRMPVAEERLNDLLRRVEALEGR